MNAKSHERAEHLIAQERVEEISPAEREWLERHLEECAACAESARRTEQALRSLRSLSVPLPAALTSRTQLRVRLRAQELHAEEPRWLLWLACGASWAFGAATAPYLWRALEWVGQRTGVPNLLWQMGFALWWALPAIVVAVVLLFRNAGQPTERISMKQRR
jgi:anti-sigma factor RsiW